MLEKTRRRMNVHSLVGFERPIRIAASLQLCLEEVQKDSQDEHRPEHDPKKKKVHRVIKVSRSNRLLDGCDIVRVGITPHDHFDALAQACELVSDIPRTTETLELQELFIAELL